MSPVQAEGPYTVVVREPTVGYDVTIGADPIAERGMRVVSKRAFETLDGDEGARDFVRELFNKGPGDQFGQDHYAEGVGAAWALSSEGGKVSLPDGTEIVVERTTYRSLIDDVLGAGSFIYPDAIHSPELADRVRAAIVAAVNEYYATREGRCRSIGTASPSPATADSTRRT